MSEDLIIRPEALEPLYAPWQEPDSHRVRVKDGEGAKIQKGRRKSAIEIVNNLRYFVRQWRENYYAGISDTSRNLLDYWFERSHRQKTADGGEYEFRYYFCQREAIETLIFLQEVMKINCLSRLVEEYGGADREIQARGIEEDEDRIARYCFKLATGSGKTKLMSLAIVWSYFHALFESDSEMARHFVVIAPNLTVFERLKEDFRPAEGGPDIFDKDPLIPPEWRGDWNMSVVLQSEASGAATGGVIYLTNIQQLYDYGKRRKAKDEEYYAWAGPSVSKQKALDTGEALRERITSHPRVMVLNDEAHHVWDPESAWNDAILYLDETIRQRSGGCVMAQLDFTATPKDNHGRPFKHVICDTPLGEAVDAGIVKTPIIGSTGNLIETPSDNAAVQWETHLRLGYERWLHSRQEWLKSGKKALLFIMCKDTKAADEITQRLNTDESFKELNGRTINLHTNLKGKIKYVGKGEDKRPVFCESEKEISDDDLKELRKLSRELDASTSPYSCIVSVLMLREGWDVRNVTTIVPLRPYSSKANILPEQTLGRGLRRMTPPGQTNELVTVVEHAAFSRLYRDELSQEGLIIDDVPVDKIPSITVSIFPDEAHKDIKALDIQIPRMSAGYRIVSKLEGLTIDAVRKEFDRLHLKKLPLGTASRPEIEYVGRHLFTDEVVEKMKVLQPLLSNGLGAISFYIRELEHLCIIKNTHTVLAPLIQTFLEEILFDKKTTLFDETLVKRLSDGDVREYLRAIFVPLIRERVTKTEERMPQTDSSSLALWKPYQATSSQKHPVLQAGNTLFNLVPCAEGLEVAFTQFASLAPDISAFAKNAGPQCLRIDYLAEGRRLAFYTPDFFVRNPDGSCCLVETKGRTDRDVPAKARAAIAWCAAASSNGKSKWEYVYIPQGVFQGFTRNTFSDLVLTCGPALQRLIQEENAETKYPLFAFIDQKKTEEEEKAPVLSGLVDDKLLEALPARYRKSAEEAIALFRFLESKPDVNFAPVFTPLLGSLDEAAKSLIIRKLSPDLPVTSADQKVWFNPYLGNIDRKQEKYYQDVTYNLKRTLVFRNGLSPIGLLRNCLDYALNDNSGLGGVFVAVKIKFGGEDNRAMLDTVQAINDLRNTYIAHQEKQLTDRQLAEKSLKVWIGGLAECAGVR